MISFSFKCVNLAFLDFCGIYHRKLSSDVANRDTAGEEYAGEPGTHVQEVRGCIPGRRK